MFFISGADTRTPIFDVEDLKAAALTRWPDASWHEIAEGSYSDEWTIPGGDRDVECRVNRKRTTIVADAELEQAVEIALWVRTLVPEEVELFLFDEQNTAAVPLTRHASAADVAAEFAEA